MQTAPEDDNRLAAAQRNSLTQAVRIEKNLASLGFFTPSSKRIKSAKKKTIDFTRLIDGEKAEARATILPSAEYGLPITADQDKFLALQKIITDLRERNGEVSNPIGFSSAELLRILGKRVAAGKNYDDIAEWLKRMTLTGISSEGTVYFAGRKLWARDTFHVFERSVSFGAEMPDGSIAERNYVWLSQWQLENINNNHLLPIDLETYRQLKNHIAKTIVPLLHIWLSVTSEEGKCEKSYSELCQILNISRYRYLSKIQEKLAPSLNELQTCGYLASWQIAKNGDDYKIIFHHGEKFSSETLSRLLPADRANYHALFAQLTNRHITTRRAKSLLDTTNAEQPILAQLQWGDAIIGHAFTGTQKARCGEIYYCLVKENLMPPLSFYASCHIPAYEAYVCRAIDNYLSARFTEAGLRRRIDLRKTGLMAKYPSIGNLRADTQRELALASIRSEAGKRISILSRREYESRTVPDRPVTSS